MDVWCMVYGVWCMVYGVWCMVYGVWCMVYSIWFMVCGFSDAIHRSISPVIKEVSFLFTIHLHEVCDVFTIHLHEVCDVFTIHLHEVCDEVIFFVFVHECCVTCGVWCLVYDV